MGIGIVGISTTGVSNQSVREQLINQLHANQTSLAQLETEISTGHQYQLPSQNPQAALQVVGIQSLLQRKDQALANISASQSQLSQTDSTLSSVSSLLTSVQSAALGVVGATASNSQRQAVVQQINQALAQMVSLGNTQYNGQQLFGGTTGASTPSFAIDAAGNVIYSGGSDPTRSYVDVNQLLATSVTGDQAFGAMSAPIEGATLPAAVSATTPLGDLGHQVSLVDGQGVAAGSIAISDGHSTSVVDLSGAHTLGDVATLIEQNPPAGRTVDVNVTPTGLTLRLEPNSAYPTGDNLSVREYNGGTTASDLGILNAAGVGPTDPPLVGKPLSAIVTPTTALGDLFGTKAQANIHFGVANSDIILQANSPGAWQNGLTVHFDSTAPAAGQETTGYNAATNTLTVHISTSPASSSRATQIVTAINHAGLPFTASLDPANQNGGGQPPISTVPADTVTAGGGGTTLDAAGLQITSGGKTYTVNVSGDKTVQDLLNSINTAGAGLEAGINAAQTGIEVRSRVSGTDFAIGENGGATAAQLGLRTFTTATALSQLNHGAGVGVNTITAGGTDFTINETATGQQVAVSIAGAATVGDVISSINAAGQAAGATFHAQLATSGNGIQLTDSGSPLVVNTDSESTAAVDLGLVPTGQTSASSSATYTAYGTAATFSNSELRFQAVDPATAGSTQVIFQANAGITPGNETVQYDQAAGTLTFQISPQSTANNVIAAVQNDPAASAAFTATLDTTSDTHNDGTGIVPPQTLQMAGGTVASRANSGLFFHAVNPGSAGNVQVIFQANAGITAGNETVNYDPTAKTLTFQISPQTTANNIIAALQNNPAASAAFTASLDRSRDPANSGSGYVQPQQSATIGGADALTGSDANPQQTDSTFNALIRLSTALTNNDNVAIQKAMTLLSNSMQNLGNTREQVGIQEQSLTTLTTQISNEEINLKSAMSTNYDTDMASTISDYTTAQIAYQATLQTTAGMLKMTLLNYL